MLLWRWKNEHKKIIIWGHLVAGAFVLHIFWGLLFFSYCRHGMTHIVLTMKKNASSIPVTFVPFQRKCSHALQSMAAPTSMTKKNVHQKKTKPRKTSVVKADQKKPAVKKVVSPKKEIVKKEIKKVSEKKEIKKEDIKPVVQKEPEIVQPFIERPNFTQSLAPIEAATQTPQGDDINNEQAELYALVAKQWTPPVGIALDKVCEVSAEIGWNQEIIKVWMSAKSGILMYDIAARKAVMQTPFPAWTKGRTVTIRFVQ